MSVCKRATCSGKRAVGSGKCGALVLLEASPVRGAALVAQRGYGVVVLCVACALRARVWTGVRASPKEKNFGFVFAPRAPHTAWTARRVQWPSPPIAVDGTGAVSGSTGTHNALPRLVVLHSAFLRLGAILVSRRANVL